MKAQASACSDNHLEEWNRLATREWASLSDWEKIQRLRATFHFAVVDELRRSFCSIRIGTALMGFCALEFIGALAAGSKATSTTFRAFCDKFLRGIDARYDSQKLWKTRCSLIHNYSITTGCSITWNQGLDNHLRSGQMGGHPAQAISLERFIDDIESASEQMFQLAREDISLQVRILRWADKAPPVGVHPI